jgi:antirestriction protein ArdC
MPDKGQFVTELAYHQTLAHELIHWTGKRLDRELTGKKDDPSYALEELVAEIGSAMLLSEFGLEPDIDNTANYCRTWGERIAADQWLVCKAAARAEKAVQYLLGKPDNAD